MLKLGSIFLGIFISIQSNSQKTDTFIVDEVIVKFNDHLVFKDEAGLNTAKERRDWIYKFLQPVEIDSISVCGQVKKANTFIVKPKNIADLPKVLSMLQKNNLIEYVEPNGYLFAHAVKAVVPNDPYFLQEQWAHYNNGRFNDYPSKPDSDIDSEKAWSITTGSENITVAIIDAGIKTDHPEFENRLWKNLNELKNGTDADSNGYVDDTLGWNFVDDNNNILDDNGHGTMVAGIALATGDNDYMYAGVNWKSKIMTCKVFDRDGKGKKGRVASAIYYAVDNGADVINFSGGSNLKSKVIEGAVRYAYQNNVPVVVGAGNKNTAIYFPATMEETIAVGATSTDDKRSAPFGDFNTGGSCFGKELDFVAPGNFIYGLSHESNSKKYMGHGTSYAAPYVTGVISLMLSKNPWLSIEEIKTILIESSEDQVGGTEDSVGWDPYYGYGRINAYQALLHPLIGTSSLSYLQNQIDIYPNPLAVERQLTVGNLSFTDCEITVLDIYGKEVYNLECKALGNRMSIDLTGLKAGNYLIRFENKANGNSILKKLILL
jgi:subtilisin family serine protease